MRPRASTAVRPNRFARSEAVLANLETVTGRIAGLPDRVDVACFPELALTGFVGDERVAEAAVSRDGPAIERLRSAAADAGVDLLVGFVEAADSLYNAAYVRTDGETVVYRKRHLWGDERAVLEPGDSRRELVGIYR